MPETDRPDRLPDGGPVYVETRDLGAAIVEPYNAATALLFIAIVAVWAWRLRGRYHLYPFLTGCLPVLLVGGVGGTLYHATRSAKIFFFMDVVPIGLLGLGASIYFWVRLRPGVRMQLAIIAIISLSAAVRAFAFRNAPSWLAISFGYAVMALGIVIPLALVLIRTGGRHFGWVLTALTLFGLALMCRVAEYALVSTLTMGTHWLWHACGAGAVQALSEYIYRIENMPLSGAPDTDPRSPDTAPSHSG